MYTRIKYQLNGYGKGIVLIEMWQWLFFMLGNGDHLASSCHITFFPNSFESGIDTLL